MLLVKSFLQSIKMLEKFSLFQFDLVLPGFLQIKYPIELIILPNDRKQGKNDVASRLNHLYCVHVVMVQKSTARGLPKILKQL